MNAPDDVAQRIVLTGKTDFAIVLAGETDFVGFRRQARALLAQGVAPDAVQVLVRGSATPELMFDGAPPRSDAAPASPLRLPATLLQRFELAALHADASRWRLMLHLLCRLQREPALRDDLADSERVALDRLARQVQREQHKMKAFVRFREVARDEERAPLHVAWFEPVHHVIEATAPFFARRFATMEWAILSPRCSVRWDGRALHFGPGARRDEAPPPDAGEALWLTYYESVFNPARLKLATMAREMPRRYWANLPETAAIPSLAARAEERAGRMVEQPPTELQRRIPIAVSKRDGEAHPTDALDALRHAAADCRDCPLGEAATQTVFGEGPRDAALMLVGEQPGDQEDLQGRPFVGPAGQLLARALLELGWPREALYITNAVKHFKFEPRGKRRLHKTPSQREAAACLHWLQGEIDAVRPRAIVALGATAARQLLGRDVLVTRERGCWFERGDGLRVLVTLHPSALLRMEPAEREFEYSRWLDDLRRACEAISLKAAS